MSKREGARRGEKEITSRLDLYPTSGGQLRVDHEIATKLEWMKVNDGGDETA